jgi:hypothetical protein
LKSVPSAALAAVTLMLLCTSTALATPPPDLGGQSWRASADVAEGFGFPPAEGDTVTTISSSCEPIPPGGASVHMLATGSADGPYPGAFQEEITVTLGPAIHPASSRDVVSISGTFTIDSTFGQVQGTLAFDDDLTRSLGDPTRAGASGECTPDPTPFLRASGAITSYEATITTPDECTYVDHGGDAEPTSETVFAGGFDVRDAPYPSGRTVGQSFMSDGAALQSPSGCSTVDPFQGFFAPVDNLPVLNKATAGRAIPVKFSLGGDKGLDIFAAGYPRSEEVSCEEIAHAQVDGIDETVTAGSSDLSYNPSTDRYQYVWKTEDNWAGTCRQFVLKLRDGGVHRANFEFK